MLASKRDVGLQFEKLAEKHLRKHGCRTVEKNFRCRSGEIDLIVIDGSTLVFVEVKFREDERFGRAVEMVTPLKQRKLVNTAQYYLQQRKRFMLMDARFDIVGITRASSKNEMQIDWIKGAFTT